MSKEAGGLGLKDTNSFNLSLLGKWKWSLFHSKGELWTRVLQSKYGGWRGLTEVTTGKDESVWWRDLKIMFNHPQYGDKLNTMTAWRVGCGEKIKFWEDRWLGGEDTLFTKYPRLYSISTQQNQYIQHMGTFKEAGWEWDFRWRRALFDNKIEMTVSFLADVACSTIQAHKEDQWEWKADPSGQYTAKSAYYVLWEELLEQQQDGAFEELWKLKLSPKLSHSLSYIYITIV